MTNLNGRASNDPNGASHAITYRESKVKEIPNFLVLSLMIGFPALFFFHLIQQKQTWAYLPLVGLAYLLFQFIKWSAAPKRTLTLNENGLIYRKRKDKVYPVAWHDVKTIGEYHSSSSHFPYPTGISIHFKDENQANPYSDRLMSGRFDIVDTFEGIFVKELIGEMQKWHSKSLKDRDSRAT